MTSAKHYDYANSKEPHLLTPGYFVSAESALDMFDESESYKGVYPADLPGEGDDLIIRSAGSTLIDKTLDMTWFVELITLKGSIISMRGIYPNGENGGLLVAQSVNPAEASDLVFE